MEPAGYRDLQPGDIPIASLPGGASARVVAGRVGDVVGPIDAKGEKATAPIFVEVVVPAGGEATVPVPVGHAGFVYPFVARDGLHDALNVARGASLIVAVFNPLAKWPPQALLRWARSWC